MNNSDLKSKILSRIEIENFSDVFKALSFVAGDIGVLEAVPVEQGNKVTQICEDYMDGKLSGEESVSCLVDFVNSVPN